MTRDQFNPTEQAILADILCNCECDCRNYLMLSKWRTVNNQRLCTGCAVNNHMAAFNIKMPSGKLQVNDSELVQKAIAEAKEKANNQPKTDPTPDQEAWTSPVAR